MNASFLLFQVDCTKEQDLAKTHDVNGSPSLYLYANGRKIDDYRGPRNAQGDFYRVFRRYNTGIQYWILPSCFFFLNWTLLGFYDSYTEYGWGFTGFD